MSTLEFFSEKKAGHKVYSRKDLVVKKNGRSADYIIPSFAVGCQLGCSYCYVARHRDFGNPLHLYGNVDDIWESVRRHAASLGPKKTPNQCDPERWTYDIGESTDCLSPLVVPTTIWFIEKFLSETEAKPTFATKLARPRSLIRVERNRARVRVSLMPQRISDILEKGTSSIRSRIDSIVPYYERGYEVHLNFSPLIGYPEWKADYTGLLQDIDRVITDPIREQLKCEIICLTHHEGLSESNLLWNPEGERYLRRKNLQEHKINQRGSEVLRYRHQDVKPYLIKHFKELLEREMPYCGIRYAF